ncbi:camelysin-like metallo-endopeptidase [Tumebacillus sp. BK434]|uniref:TasA family protein n=1 Tax=Tumebacillus sp. BK434 TaxID=2512169 RepID=UPI00104293F8|nr:TasA family protein [Tumebacillus sp. BK434]TCP52735.1 camelysin-like metallo-endopeptidase [Tumebacillus sp. BK434]
MKKKIALAMVTTALGATLVGAGSFALFTAETTNTGNNFTAGTLTLQDLSGGPIASQAVNFGNLAPGDNGVVKMTVKNNGSLDAWVRINQTASNASRTGDLFGGATPLQLIWDAKVVKVPAGGTTTFDVGYLFPLAADNSYQGDTGSFHVVVQAVQARNNTNAANNGPIAWN